MHNKNLLCAGVVKGIHNHLRKSIAGKEDAGEGDEG